MIDPRGMELADWCDSVAYDVEQESNGSLPILVGDAWQEWGVRVINLLVPNQQHAPDPLQYSDWREWGERLVLYLGTNS